MEERNDQLPLRLLSSASQDQILLHLLSFPLSYDQIPHQMIPLLFHLHLLKSVDFLPYCL